MIANESGLFYCNGWVGDLRRAHVYTATETAKIVRRLSLADKRLGVSITYAVHDYRDLLRQAQPQGPGTTFISRGAYRHRTRYKKQHTPGQA